MIVKSLILKCIALLENKVFELSNNGYLSILYPKISRNPDSYLLHNKQSNFFNHPKEYGNKSLVCYHPVREVIYHLVQFMLK